MKKSTVIIFGIASVMPAACIAPYITSLIFDFPFSDFEQQAFLYWTGIIVNYTVAIALIVNVFLNPNVKKKSRVLWVLMIIFLGMYAMPAYWYTYIWQPHKEQQEL